jgi:transcriptional regulator with XRE-family HTH domain
MTALGTSVDRGWLSAGGGPMATIDKDLIPRVASRLPALRKEANQHLQIRTVDEFAAFIGAERNQVSNWLNAYNLPPVWMMVRLCERFGITLDWLVRGTVGTLPPGQVHSAYCPAGEELGVPTITLLQSHAVPR